ncbi:hypothetical protein [Streptomyces liangshanensis]|uniref:Uncharacterized protein n=1 Tax=Streptomyces liangshanensis TaxID=2717324 RepID=A0A6G9GRT0_9ACTN|nr:hypothetical protein [Streptomyces liangshanensis]QIQ00910.1 hypothetical protein HA039_00085 [Streptomyces liangshanensis]
MEHDATAEARQERSRAERLTERLTVTVASVLSFVLLLGPVWVAALNVWHAVTETGLTTFSRFVVPVLGLALVALPLVLARRVFLSGRRRGKPRPTAAVPAALTLLGLSVVPFAALCLVFAYGS